MTRLMFSLAAFVIAAFMNPTRANAALEFCAGTQDVMAKDLMISDAIKALPNVVFSKKVDACLFPLKLLHYPDANVLITNSMSPDALTSHAAGAKLSAYVLAKRSTGAKLVARFQEFDEVGSFGIAESIIAVQLGTDDGIAVESGGTFQGFGSDVLSLYSFRDHRLINLQPSLPLNAENGGAFDEANATGIEGKWTIPGPRFDQVVIDYDVDVKGKKRKAQAVWSLRPEGLSLASGAVPPEMAAAGGH